MLHEIRAPFNSDTAVLLGDYPRDGWESHDNLRQPTINWLNAHAKFRVIGAYLEKLNEAWLDKDMSNDDFANEFGYYGNLLVSNLHGHHTWEDSRFFPEIFAAEPRAERAIDLLESDHAQLDGLLDKIRSHGNRAIQLAVLDEAKMKDEIEPLHGSLTSLNALLDRHLTDEEDAIVPILLHHKLRG